MKRKQSVEAKLETEVCLHIFLFWDSGFEAFRLDFWKWRAISLFFFVRSLCLALADWFFSPPSCSSLLIMKTSEKRFSFSSAGEKWGVKARLWLPHTKVCNINIMQEHGSFHHLNTLIPLKQRVTVNPFASPEQFIGLNLNKNNFLENKTTAKEMMLK